MNKAENNEPAIEDSMISSRLGDC